MKIREYELLEKIGQPGGMAVVYKAKHQSLEVLRAIKKLHFHLAANTNIIMRFENEARALSILEHPNIVKVYDFFREGEDYYLVMEYVDGPSLAEILKKTAIDETRALNYLKQILSTMAFAHDKKILHRDIKPSNILINSKDIVKVVDFGIAKMMDRKGLTSTGLTMGSPWYMSPEQIMGYELDARSDIYSLGITLFEMLSGQVPFNDTSEYKIYEMHQKKPIPSVREINKKLSTDIDAIIQKATAKDPNERYQNAMEFSEAVDIYLALKEFGDPGSTIANFDPFEYIEFYKTKIQSKTGIDISADPKNTSQVSAIDPDKLREAINKTRLMRQKEKEQIKTDIGQKDTVFQDSGMTKEGARATSEYINKKKITGLESNIKSFSFNKKSMGIIAGIIVLFLIVIIFLSDSSPEKIKINSNDILYSSIGLNWQKYDNADHYIIHRKKANESEYQFIRKITLNAFIDSMVAPNEKYIYRITANDNDDKILAIGEIDLNTPKLDLKMKVSNITSSKIRLSWPQVENNPLYILYRKDKNSDIKPGREIYRGNENNYEDRYLKPDHSYSYILRIQFDNLQEVELAGLNVMTGPLPKISHPVDVKKQFFGDLQVNSTPPEAVVFLDGQKIGTTPLIKTGLKTGDYNLVVRKEGYKDFTSHVNIKRGEMIRVNSVLSFLKGRLSIQVLPYGSIFINDKLVIENTPVKYSKEYSAGTYKVKVVHERIKALWEKTITIKGNEEKKIYIDFNKKVKVTITSNPWGTIFIDGKSTGKVTPKKIEITFGFHVISVQRDGFEMVEEPKAMNFENDVQNPVKFTLRKK